MVSNLRMALNLILSVSRDKRFLSTNIEQALTQCFQQPLVESDVATSERLG
jgi:hypothetical protein